MSGGSRPAMDHFNRVLGLSMCGTVPRGACLGMPKEPGRGAGQSEGEEVMIEGGSSCSSSCAATSRVIAIVVTRTMMKAPWPRPVAVHQVLEGRACRTRPGAVAGLAGAEDRDEDSDDQEGKVMTRGTRPRTTRSRFCAGSVGGGRSERLTKLGRQRLAVDAQAALAARRGDVVESSDGSCRSPEAERAHVRPRPMSTATSCSGSRSASRSSRGSAATRHS